MNANEIESLLIDKLLTLTTAQLIRYMVVGLRTRHTEISMASYGHIVNDVCYGCAATNAILEILSIQTEVYISRKDGRDNVIVAVLELFYDNLRWGTEQYSRLTKEYGKLKNADENLVQLNSLLGKEGHFQPVKCPKGLALPYLTDDYTEDDLLAYLKLANCQ